ncbi:MAG: hypothetical protein R3C41_12080 [Calditrichia bacterium]
MTNEGSGINANHLIEPYGAGEDGNWRLFCIFFSKTSDRFPSAAATDWRFRLIALMPLDD